MKSLIRFSRILLHTTCLHLHSRLKGTLCRNHHNNNNVHNSNNFLCSSFLVHGPCGSMWTQHHHGDQSPESWPLLPAHSAVTGYLPKPFGRVTASHVSTIREDVSSRLMALLIYTTPFRAAADERSPSGKTWRYISGILRPTVWAV